MLDVSFATDGNDVAVVTGAAGGIGAAVVDAFLAAGVAVVAVDIRIPPERGGRAAEGKLDRLAADMTVEADVAALVERLRAVHGRVDHVVHAAGVAGGGELADTSFDDWRRVIDANLSSAFLLARAVHPLLAASKGSLVLLGSSNGFNGGSRLSGPAYASAKAAIHNFVRYLAKEWAGDGIRVNAVAPGPVDTPMVQRLGDDTRAAMRAAVPLGREGTAAEMAANILFLCSRGAAWQTGSVVNISGGLVL
jgi:NAD(P)-dependent dehydrogenase (short-subunit alcohol dehydrogenase family)